MMYSGSQMTKKEPKGDENDSVAHKILIIETYSPIFLNHGLLEAMESVKNYSQSCFIHDFVPYSPQRYHYCSIAK